MILVTLGTQSQKFYRLLDAIENLNTKEEIIVQAGGSADYKSEKMKIFDFISYEEMNDYIDKADLIITHGGTGSIIMPLQKKKKIIACARLEKYGEHINDHQKEIVDVFAKEKYILNFNDGDDLQKIYEESKDFIPKKYDSNTKEFKKNLQKEIDFSNKKTLFWPFAIMLFVLFALLNHFIPLSGDDWGNAMTNVNSIFQAISLALDRFFLHEGRLISRIFIYLFSSNKFIWNLLCAFLITITFVLINKLVNNKSNKFIIFLTFTFFLFLNNEVLKETIFWLTGNLTYFLPTVLSLIFLYINRRILDNEFNLSGFKFIISLVLLALVSMMVEPVSAAMVLATFILFIFTAIKLRKFDVKRFSYFVIITIGFILMICSPGASMRLNTTTFSNMGIIDKIINNIANFINYTYLINSFLIILMSLSIYLILKNNKIKFSNIFSVLLFIFVGFTVLINCYKFAQHYFNINIGLLNKLLFLGNSNNVLIIIIWILFTLLFIYLIFKYIKGNEKFKIIFYTIIGYSANCAMLLSPIWGGRTTFFTVFMLFIACMFIFNYYKYDLFDNKIIKYILVFFTICFIICMLILYHSVYLQNKDRELSINKQIKDNKKIIEYYDIPFYAVFNPNASTEYHQQTFKNYYGIKEDVKLKRLTLYYKYAIIYKGEDGKI